MSRKQRFGHLFLYLYTLYTYKNDMYSTRRGAVLFIQEIFVYVPHLMYLYRT